MPARATYLKLLFQHIATVAALAASPGRAQSTDDLAPRLEKLAEAGDAEALYHLGMFHHMGVGMPRDQQKALAYFRRAAAAGDPLAAYKLGCFYAGQDEVLPIDMERALANKLVAARAGYALAQQDVGAIYMERGDAAAAELWLGRAAAQGWPDALFAFASLHNGKNGLPRDLALVVAYFELFLAGREAGPQQRTWLETRRSELTPVERGRAEQLVAAFRPAPTPLTIKGLSGQRAAEALVTERGR